MFWWTDNKRFFTSSLGTLYSSHIFSILSTISAFISASLVRFLSPAGHHNLRTLPYCLLSQKEIDLIQQVDEAKLTPDKHIETKYGLGTIRNLSSGCKTLLNIVKHPDKVVNVEECGPNVLRIIFTMDNIKIYMSRPTLKRKSPPATGKL